MYLRSMKYLSLLAVGLMIMSSCNRDTLTTCPIAAPPYYYTNGGATIQFPTAFTPNGDGRNDVFRPVGITGITNYSMTVYDAGGGVMFRTNDPYGFGWTGKTSSGMELAAGRYPVNFQFTTLNGEVVNKDICVSLLSYGGANCITRTNGEVYYFEDQLDPSNPGHNYPTAEIMCP
jgi:gliding motility-associated-like protein